MDAVFGVSTRNEPGERRLDVGVLVFEPTHPRRSLGAKRFLKNLLGERGIKGVEAAVDGIGFATLDELRVSWQAQRFGKAIAWFLLLRFNGYDVLSNESVIWAARSELMSLPAATAPTASFEKSPAKTESRCTRVCSDSDADS